MNPLLLIGGLLVVALVLSLVAYWWRRHTEDLGL